MNRFIRREQFAPMPLPAPTGCCRKRPYGKLMPTDLTVPRIQAINISADNVRSSSRNKRSIHILRDDAASTLRGRYRFNGIH
jgi:hypothetical protein